MTAPVINTSVDDNDNNDDCHKAFLSRIPQAFTTETVKNLLETNFGIDCVSDVVIVYDRSDTNEGGIVAHRSNNATVEKLSDKQQQHRGFGFVTFTTQEQYQTAIDSGTVRGSISAKSHRKYTLYIRPVIRADDSSNNNYYSGTSANDGNVTTTAPKEDELKNICFLWTKHRCPYGTNCKFMHVGEGGCSTTTSNGDDAVTSVTNKKTKTKKTKHNKDDDNMKTTTTKEEKDKSQIDCINYKNKGICRKGDKCPYRHDANSLRNNKKKKQQQLPTTSNTMDDSTTITIKKRQSLSIRVFGLNYTTTEQDLHDYFTYCGKIMEITFPTYEDSGRSKGYCGVLFTSPKAVEKAVALDGGELHGRWLRIQEGKMYLKKWEEAESKRSSRKEGSERLGNSDDVNSGGDCETGEYGQKVKRRKKHGFKDE